MGIKHNQGFSLLELMIVVMVLGIIAAIAYPSYNNYIEQANRSEGRAFLMDIAAKQERYRSQNNAYILAIADVGKMGGTSSSETERYTLDITKVDGDGGYSLTATPTRRDSKCGALTLNARGIKGVSAHNGVTGNRDTCW